jgi:hypothetical protein
MHAWCPSLGGGGARIFDNGLYRNHLTVTTTTPSSAWSQNGIGGGGLTARVNNAATGQYLISGNTIDWSGLSITVSFWFATGSIISLGRLFSKNDTTTFTLQEGSGRITWGANGGGADSGFTVPTTLTHVCATWSPSLRTLYINGNQVYSVASGTITSSTAPVLFGNRTAGDRSQNGIYDDMIIYRRVLPRSEIRQLASRRGIIYELDRTPRAFVASAPTGNRRRRLICGANC